MCARWLVAQLDHLLKADPDACSLGKPVSPRWASDSYEPAAAAVSSQRPLADGAELDHPEGLDGAEGELQHRIVNAWSGSIQQPKRTQELELEAGRGEAGGAGGSEGGGQVGVCALSCFVLMQLRGCISSQSPRKPDSCFRPDSSLAL